jgi:aspartyl-tRNA(Asn)/glutamyl-tRNA(Gln) amidotransferase subunit C
MKIDDKLIEHLCFLGRLSLSPQDKGLLKQDLSKILSYVDSLKEIDVTNIEPLIHSLDEKDSRPEGRGSPEAANIWRDDKASQNSLPPDKALRNAPKRKDNFFEVPRIIE